MLYLNVFIFSAILASFIQVAATHFPLKQPFMFRFSQCDFCKRRLSFFEMIPLFSFIALRGKTWCCKKRLSYSYFITELTFPILFTFLVYLKKSASHPILPLTCFVFLFFFLLTDLAYLHIPDSAVLVFLGIILLIQFKESVPFSDILWQFLLSFCFYGILYFIFRKGFGMGDTKLLIILGTALGFKESYWIFFLALACANLFFGLTVLFRKIPWKTKIPFVPFLFTGFLIYLISH
ncbi:prepilin peptidase [Listeria aquatica]|uniref:Prepilin peptidase n=1 Tax=Listeria aquatica TaxID=1494960 RepID=A0A841ZL02_9LIST|nr:prepilin peptidase [Listeria aquatica]